MGIVSAKGRANMGITEYEDFIDDSQAVLKAMNKIFSVIEILKMDMDIKL